MPVENLPDIPLDQPLRAPQRQFARPATAAPAPLWVAPLYLTLSLLLVPWMAYLAVASPAELGDGHWRVAWVGLDAMEAVALALTARLAYRRSTWVDIAATATFVLLVVDAWFDIATADAGWGLVQAIATAVVLELPLAALSLWVARHAQVMNESVTRWLIDRSSRQAAFLHEAVEHGFVADAPADPEVTPPSLTTGRSR